MQLSTSKTPFGYNKATNYTECLHHFIPEILITNACWLKKFYQNIQWQFSDLFSPWKI